MKRAILGSKVPWSYYDKKEFDEMDEKYLPRSGEGDTMMSQINVAINKLVYKWYNDGDVFDNTYGLNGWANDLSSYANWLHKYVPESKGILEKIMHCDEDGYSQLLKSLADTLLLSSSIENKYKAQPKVGSVYDCSGPFEFVDYDDDDDDW